MREKTSLMAKMRKSVSSSVESVTATGHSMTDKAVSSAVANLLSTMKYASQKIREADEDLPEGTMLRVSASAVIVELSLEVPVKEIRNGNEDDLDDLEVIVQKL